MTIVWAIINIIAQALLKHYLGKLSEQEVIEHETKIKEIYKNALANRPVDAVDAVKQLRDAGLVDK